MPPWLQRVRHDLIKRALWPARDLAALLAEGRAASAADAAALRAGLFDLRDPEGAACDAAALLARLRAEAPPQLAAALRDPLDALAAAIAAAQSALEVCVPEARPPAPPDPRALGRALAAVLELDRRFAALAAAA